MVGLSRALRTGRVWLLVAALSAAAASACWWPGVALPGGARPLHAVLVDVSASVVRARPAWRSWRDEQLNLERARALEDDHALFVASFADGFEVLFGPADAGELETQALPATTLADSSSELGRALEALVQRAAQRPLARVIVLGDGRFDGVDPRDALDQLRQLGAEFELRRPPPPELADLSVESLRAPREVEVGAPLAVAAQLGSLAAPLGPSARAVVEFRVVDRRGARSLERIVTPERFDGGASLVACDLGPLEEGLTRISARVRLEGASDVVPENDECATRVRSRGARVIGVVAARAPRFEAWLDECRDLAGLQWLEPVTALDQLPLDACDALVTLDCDPRELDEGRVRDFVRRGGGWLALGAQVLVGAKAAQPDGGLTELLPLALESRQERDLLLLLDGSGSMDPAASAELRAASLEVARRAPAAERIVLWWFTDRLQDAFELRPGFEPAAREHNVASWTAARAPGGPTDIVAVLDELARRRAGGGPALALLISDGRDQRERGTDAARLEQAISAIASANVRLAVVAAGAQADRAWLDELARFTARGRAWSAADASLAEALASELAREHSASEGGAVAVSAASADDESDVSALRAAWNSLGALPPAGEVVRTRARPGDAIALELAGGEPVIALRRSGAGWCAAWTSDPTSSGSPAWVRASGAIAPLLRTLVRAARGEARAELRARLDSRGRWRVEGLGDGTPARVWLADATSPRERTSADIPSDVNALDPRGVRIANAPGSPRARELIVSSALGDELARVSLDPSAPAEFARVRHELPPGVQAPLGAPAAARGDLGGRRRTLGLAAALVSLAALALAVACSNWVSVAGHRQVLPSSRR